ncbi:MAG: bifunctional DNA primase/polymerase, partial [Tepidisphaeraceae bacterium]
KKPTVKWKPFQERRPTDDELRRFFSSRGVTGVAVVFGGVSGGLADRDFDTIAGYESFREKNPALARSLPTYRTDRGFHVWFRSNRQGIVNLGDGEFRGAGYSLAPHSRRKGGVYDWTNPLPKGPLPEVNSAVFVGANVTEGTEAICSVSSALSVLSVTSSTPPHPDPNSIINSTLPTQPGERNSCILNLARGLKFNAGLANADGDTLEKLLRRWHTLALPIVGTKDFDTTRADFLHAFDRARYPLGVDFVDQAALHVDPGDLPDVASSYDSIPARQLIGLCYQLSRLNDAGRFFLSCHDAAPRLKLKPMGVWRLLRMFERDGAIEAMERGNERKATRYRWIASAGDKG